MNRKRVIVMVTIVLAVIAMYVYREYNRMNLPMIQLKSAYNLNASEFLLEYEKDISGANKKYLGKVITVTGPIKDVEKEDYVIVIGDTNSLSSIRCSLDSMIRSQTLNLLRGSIVQIKGNCTGYNKDEMLGSDVILNRSVIIH